MGRSTVVIGMGTDPCDCCATTEKQVTEPDAIAERWLTGDSVLDAELPMDLQSTLGRFLGRDPVATLGEWALEIRDRTDGDAISVTDLCHADAETDHRGTMDGERYYFACFFDAIALAALEDDAVEIHTRSPVGDAIELRADGADVPSTTPQDAVVSFGVDESVDRPAADDEPTLEATYAAVCPYVKAFPARGDYVRWAERAPAATVAMPIGAAVDLAAALAQ